MTRRVRHTRRGTTYRVLGTARAQVSLDERQQPFGLGLVRQQPMVDGVTEVIVYQDEETGKLYCRRPEEFEDGRFENIPPLPASGHGEVAGLVPINLAALAIAKRRDAWKPGERIAPDYLKDASAAVHAYLKAVRSKETPAPSPVEARADGVRVKALEWQSPPISETLSRAETIIGTARVWTHHEANGSWFWKLGDLASGTEANAADAKKMLWLTYEHHILAALESTPAQPVHPDDLAVDRFAAAMKAKLAKKREDGRGGWERKDECSNGFLSLLLVEHVEKGDPVDVGNLAMMIHQRGETIADERDRYAAKVQRSRAQPVREEQEGKTEPRMLAALLRINANMIGVPDRVSALMREASDLLASQLDPAAEIARLTKERDDARWERDICWAEGVKRAQAGQEKANG